jgi:hypothetical protein
MNQDILPELVKRINVLIKHIEDPSYDRESLLSEAIKIRQWLLQGRSLREHRMFQKFITYMYQAYGTDDGFSDRSDYKDWLLYKVGYCKKTTREKAIDLTCPRCELELNAILVKDTNYSSRSLSFGACSQKVHHEIVESVFAFCDKHYQGFSSEAWRREFDSFENLL